MNNKILIPGIISVLVILGIVFINLNRGNLSIDKANAITSIIAYNQTQGSDALIVDARKQDIIVYTLTAETPTTKVIEGFALEISIEGITELATLIDAQGANYNSFDSTLKWTAQDILTGGLIEKQFTVKVKDTLPANSDLVMSADFNNEVRINVNPQERILGVNIDNTDGTTATATNFVSPPTGVSGVLSTMFAALATLGAVLFRFRRK